MEAWNSWSQSASATTSSAVLQIANEGPNRTVLPDLYCEIESPGMAAVSATCLRLSCALGAIPPNGMNQVTRGCVSSLCIGAYLG